ncbi:glycoside hydrolase family 25 protein [Bifidobacterium callitrichos]|uniref:Glycosyl hydrolase family 25 n=1 Tax=Bifidobacterium callitrichos DSM 23973 TaxID=1437609 RepID=A0A087A0R6_9BIFI|nr:glycoside hydrolase family 25 protein [Bifidobacterium callitrichos]KFI52366.1 glycosyl hydrolase family 25 [Bifidobacterium callitrichos DSM 23973]
MSKLAKCIAVVSAAAMAVSFALPAIAQPLRDTNLDASATVTLQSQTSTEDSADAMPENPDVALPDKVAKSIPDDATVVSANHAVVASGQLKDLETGKTVTDPKLVGTKSEQPDPLAKTDGESFIPVEAGDVKTAVKESESDAPRAFAKPISLDNNQYGAYWGTYNGTQAFFEADGKLFAQSAKGVVDVSEWQKDIDWQAAKNSGVEGAIVRIGYGWGNGLDQQAARNINALKRLGIPFGVYLYSYAYDANTAAKEGTNVVNLLRKLGVTPNDMEYPVYYDLERWTWTGHVPPSDPDIYDAMVNAWYGQLQAAGYNNLSIYSYTSYLNSALKSSNIWSKTRWVASYGARSGFSFPTNDRGWQYTSSGTVNGIPGSVDLNAFGYARSIVEPGAANSVYRLYNPNSGLHHYTTVYNEALTLATIGWRYEGVSFLASDTGSPVYRLYNPNDGNHLFTMENGERLILASQGWKDEGVAWYVDGTAANPVYRLYNPNSGEHVYTTNADEYEQVGQAGWHQEGVAWRTNG